MNWEIKAAAGGDDPDSLGSPLFPLPDFQAGGGYALQDLRDKLRFRKSANKLNGIVHHGFWNSSNLIPADQIRIFVHFHHV